MVLFRAQKIWERKTREEICVRGIRVGWGVKEYKVLPVSEALRDSTARHGHR